MKCGGAGSSGSSSGSGGSGSGRIGSRGSRTKPRRHHRSLIRFGFAVGPRAGACVCVCVADGGLMGQ